MKRDVLLRKARLALIPLVLALIALLAARTVSSQKTACALANGDERASLSSQKLLQSEKTKQQAGQTGTEEPAALEEIESLPAENAPSAAQPGSSTGTSPEGTAPSSNGGTAATQPTEPNDQNSTPHIQTVGQVNTPSVDNEACLLVKFKTGTTQDRINAIVAANHANVIKTIAQIDVYQLGVADGTPVLEALNGLRQSSEVEYAELDGQCNAPEPAQSIQPLQ